MLAKFNNIADSTIGQSTAEPDGYANHWIWFIDLCRFKRIPIESTHLCSRASNEDACVAAAELETIDITSVYLIADKFQLLQMAA
jgi:hypothetical protein